LDIETNSVFDPSKSKSFESGDGIRWLLQNNEGVYIGRIAAFSNLKSIASYELLAGGCGFFECINSQDAAKLLFDTARTWLESKGMEAMDGPINFGDRDKWWGLLVDGFHEPCYQCNYNPPYYQELFETYGFKT